jgi:hypothetical protein
MRLTFFKPGISGYQVTESDYYWSGYTQESKVGREATIEIGRINPRHVFQACRRQLMQKALLYPPSSLRIYAGHTGIIIQNFAAMLGL